jgi:ABC-type transport system involved in cytochrome c biogenesis ATPase subunit
MKPINAAEPVHHRLAGSAHSWPQDYPHENGNYESVCLSCGVHFLGHKRRIICQVCDLENLERWSQMPEEERRETLTQAWSEMKKAFIEKTNA